MDKYRAKDESYMSDNVASPQHKLEEEEIFAVALKRCLCCAPQKKYYDNAVEKEYYDNAVEDEEHL